MKSRNIKKLSLAGALLCLCVCAFFPINKNFKITARTDNTDRIPSNTVGAENNYNDDVNAKDNDRWTPLMEAAQSGDPDAVSALIKAGTYVNAKDKNGWNALKYAIDSGNLEVVTVLVKAGANPYAKNKYGETPLMYAVSGKCLDCVKALKESPCGRRNLFQLAARLIFQLEDEGCWFFWEDN